MSIPAIKEKAIAYEALSLFFKGDRDKAWSVLTSLNADFSSPFASYTREFTSSFQEEAEFNEIWRKTRDAFSNERIPFSVIDEEDERVKGSMAPVHFLYTAGAREIGKEKRLVILGSPLPSLQAKSDIFDAVSLAAEKGWAVVAPFDSGSGAYTLQSALKLGALPVAVLSSGISKCPSESLLELMEQVYSKGILITQASPSVKYEKWHVVLRNRFLSSFGDGFFLVEEKNGGPSWAIFDSALEKGKKTSISFSAATNPNFTWCGERLKDDVVPYKKPKDLLKLFGEEKTPRKRKDKYVELTPSLFD
ncbi:MAG: DNA-processing protein DprA [Candidatus Ornithospirochaeta sp.]